MVNFWVQLWYRQHLLILSVSSVCGLSEPFALAAALLEHCFGYHNYLAVNSCHWQLHNISSNGQELVEHWTATTFYFILHSLPNICKPYIIPEAEIPENWTVVFRRRPHRDTDRLERQSGEYFHGEECPRGRGSEEALEVGCWRPHQNMQLGSFQSWKLPVAK